MDFTTTRKDGAVTTSTPGMPSGAGDDFGAVIAKIMQSRRPQAPAQAPRLAKAPVAGANPQTVSAPTLGQASMKLPPRRVVHRVKPMFQDALSGVAAPNPKVWAGSYDPDLVSYQDETPNIFYGAMVDRDMENSYKNAPMNLSGWSGPTVTTDNKGRPR